MIILAGNTEDELRQLARPLLELMFENGSRVVESERFDYGGGNYVQLRLKRQMGRGGVAVPTMSWYVNGHRRGIREICGIIDGRWNWPTPAKRPLA